MRALKFWPVLSFSLCFVSVALTTSAGEWSGPPLPQRARQSKAHAKTLADTIKWLGTVIDGNSAETGKRPARYDSYKYESFRSEGCTLFWRETHESFEGQTRLSKTLEDLRIPLPGLSQSSVRVDKVGASVYVVSFTTLRLKTAITARSKATYQDGSVDTFTSLRSGYGVYFQNGPIAREVARAVVFSIRSCQKEQQLQPDSD